MKAADGRDELSPIKRALLDIRALRSRVSSLESAASEPIAIVGLACRLPGGVRDADSLWQVLRDGVDTISEVPVERWNADELYDADPDRPGTMWTRCGGFLDDIDRFDAAFFGISPREAASMDPQQRLFLEVAWEALEDAGIAADGLAGSATGVFTGVGNTDYFRLLFSRREQIDAYAGSGGSASVIAGRLSYQLGLQGPSMAIDTACSASLVAVHLACQSLRRGECDLALAGGINLILGPEAHIAFTKARMMAPDGRCKTFDAAADGYGRGEGVAVIALRRLSDSVARGDRILALIRGSAVNQDGRSAGLTAPNGPAQVAVIRSALRDARLAPADIDYIEAHGTGTSLGDPIELQAISEALCTGRVPEQALRVGSCKTNFGHLEAAAGIAGLLKVVCSLAHRQIPPNLHFARPNPLVDWHALPLEVPTKLEPWPLRDAPARAGVSSFGFSGTNAHVVLEEAPLPIAADHSPDRPLHLLALSAPNEAALAALAQRHLDRLGSDPSSIADLCWTANAGRAQFARRLAVTGRTADDFQRGLAAYLAGTSAPDLWVSPAGDAKRAVICLLFTGQGTQYADMGRMLYATLPLFRATIDECAAVLDPLLERPLLQILYPQDGDSPLLHHTGYAQPALFALEYALSVVWRRWGLEPAVLLGHSVGEVVAACVAGVFSLPDALRLIAARGRLMQSLPAGGAMASADAAPAEIDRLVAAHALDVDIAAFNGPQQVVISGAGQAIDAACALLDAQGRRSKRLSVSHAFHSRAMEPILDTFEHELRALRFEAPRTALISNVSGRLADAGEIGTPVYWREHIRRPVRFEESVRAAAALGVSHFVEIGPAPVLLGMGARILPGDTTVWLPSMRPRTDDWEVLLASLAALYVAGAAVNWMAFDADYPRRRVALPTYPFQRRRHWLDNLDARGGSARDPEHAWRSVSAALDRQASMQPLGLDLTDYGAKWACLERLTLASAIDVLRAAGVFTKAGERSSAAQVRERLGAADSYRHLIERWLARLVEAGHLRADADDFVCDQPLPDPEVAAHLAEAARQLAGNAPLLAYIRQCAGLLVRVIGGHESPLETLFPGGSFELAEGLYRDSAPARYINELAAGALQAWIAARAPGAELRVLEIGAGTGGTSSALLPLLPAQHATYCFTDVSAVFLERAREQFVGFPFVRCQAFDLEGDPAAQGITPGGFELVIAANAVHATRNLRTSLDRLRTLLAPGGLLLLVESTEHLAWFDMTTGLIEGWQRFEDDLRGSHPLLSAPQWVEALRGAGFADAAAWPKADSPAAAIGQHLIVAHAPGHPTTIAGSAAPASTAAHVHSEPGVKPAEAAFRERLLSAWPADRPDLLRDFVRERVMQVLRLDAEQAPGPNDRLFDLGFDSLMAVQLRSELSRGLGLDKPLPATLLFDHPTTAAITQFVIERLALPVDTAAETAPADVAPAGVDASRTAAVAAMSDEQIEALLLERFDARSARTSPPSCRHSSAPSSRWSRRKRALSLPRRLREPIAVIGLGCRVPGADDPAAFWELLRDGVDAIGPVPAGRFDLERVHALGDAPGGSVTREAGFLQQVDGFDAGFFGISRREAHGMDPQQRLLLEVSWEALEHAGQAPDGLERSATGVYFGVCSNDYANLQLKADDPALLDAHYTSGLAHSVASGRLSYVLGLQGPSLTIDTACSSSLVAVHLACQALRAGDCRMALAGGVNLMLSSDLFVAFSHSRMLAPDGRCKAFDSTADGFGRGEGCGVVVLKRLADARADRDRILAVIRGSAVNQDGPSSGLTAPNGPAQEAVIRTALRCAGIEPAAVGYLEAHGTGTQLGDPLEVQALGAVFGDRDAAQPLLIGSVKTNVGHLEAAAGVAGLIKLVLALRARQLPPHLHFRDPSPHIAWDELPLRVPVTLTPWEAIDGRRIAGVSSFGFSGTNAHVVVEEAPALVAPPPVASGGRHLFVLSARDPAALAEMARRYARAFADLDDTALPDVCFSAAAGRAHLPQRATVLAASMAELCTRLRALAEGQGSEGVRSARVVRRDPARIAFLFTGQGSQYAGMARVLDATQPVFRAALERCAAVLDARLPRPLREVLYAAESPSPLDETGYTQPALFALEYALAELWRAWGVRPDMLIGHSVGEVVAACVAGVLSLDDALALIAERGRLMQALPPGGAMAAMSTGGDAVAVALAPHARQASIAAYNGPSQTVISGTATAVEAVCAAFAERGVRCQRLPVSHAFHSPLVEPMLDAFEAHVSRASLKAPALRLVSNLTGEVADAREVVRPRYWRRHVREAVRFADGMCTLAALRPDVCIEIGPHPTLLALAEANLAAMPETSAPLLVGSLRKGRDDNEQLAESLGALYLAGVALDWRAVWSAAPRRWIDLPSYAFQREPCWFPHRPAAGGAGGRDTGHPLLGVRMRSALRDVVQFEQSLRCDSLPYLADHRVHGQAILPATAFLEAALAAGRAVFGGACEVQDLAIVEPLRFDTDETRLVQVIVRREEAGSAAFEMLSSVAGAEAEDWHRHAEGRLRTQSAPVDAAPPLAAVRARCTETLGIDAHHAQLAARGLDFGPSLRGLRSLTRGQGEALGEVLLPEPGVAGRGPYVLHPALLDACLQVMSAALDTGDGADAQRAWLPLAIASLQVLRAPSGTVWSHVRVHPERSGMLGGEVTVYDTEGVVATLRGIALRPAAVPSATQPFYEIAWRPLPPEDAGWMPAPAALHAKLGASLAALAAEHGLDAYQRAFVELEALCADWIAAALAELGWRPVAGERVVRDELARRLGVVPRYRRLLARWLDIIAEDGMLRRDSSGWTVVSALAARSQPELADAARALLARYPSSRARIVLSARCGARLADIARGAVDPLAELFPDGSTELAESLYRDAPEAQAYNQLVRDTVRALLAELPAGQRLRVLEVGAGTGGTTAWVAPALPAERTEYLYTDVGASLVMRAREKFAAHPFMSFQSFDLEQAPAAQGLGERRFDVILASNVVHATADLRQTLTRLRELLAPGGMLLMLEVAGFERWIDITFGLTDGWWRYTDTELRADYPLLSRAAWLDLLAGMNFEAAPVGAPDARSREVLLAARRPAGDGDTLPAHGRWLVLADRGGVAAALAGRLRAGGQNVVLIGGQDAESEALGSHDDEALRRLVMQHAAGLSGLIHLRSLDLEPGASDAPLLPAQHRSLGDASLSPALRNSLGALIASVQGLGACSFAAGATPRLCVVTRAAVAVATAPRELQSVQAPVQGLAKVIALEHPELRCLRIDLDPNATVAAQAEALCARLAAGSAEDQLAQRASAWYAARLVRSAQQPAIDEPLRLDKGAGGVFDELHLRAAPRRPPGAGEVEIRVVAAGLNFRDVMNAVALRDDPEPLGGECAGRVVAVGDGVADVAVGDHVVAIAEASFATYATTSAALVRAIPEGLGFAEAATLPFAFMTADHALHALGGMARGETVLIHAAAGGVGMAAIQLARAAGTHIIATAGSDEKRACLRALGIEHVLDSRTLEFEGQVRELMRGEGVDLVLNSLAGDFIGASVRCLARDGRFLEIGKRDIWSAERFAQVRPQGRYHAIDLAAMRTGDLPATAALFARTIERIERGELHALPRTTFALEQAADAFRFMAMARHVGKVVLTQADPQAASLRALDARAAYLVTGGLSGLGLLTAQRLVERGARHLMLVGRRAPSQAAAAAIAALRASGAQVLTLQADISSADEVRRVLAVIAPATPLRGIVHAAGVLEDGALMQQGWERFAIPLGPKVDGTWALHAQTRRLRLDFFVLYSSMASVLGSRGQGNHAAANAFMDALAAQRRAEGLPAQSIGWGAWSEVGAAAERGVEQRIEAHGVEAISPRRGLDALETVMGSAAAHVAVFPVRWGEFVTHAEAGRSPMLSELRKESRSTAARAPLPAAAPAACSALLEQLRDASRERRHELLLDFVGEQVARVIGAAGDAIDPRQPLQELGLDSLMAVELRNRLGTGLGLARSLPATLVFDHPTLEALSRFLARDVLGAGDEEAMPLPAAAAPDAVGVIDELSDDEIEQMYAKRMGR